jgi:alpha-mannosidase
MKNIHLIANAHLDPVWLWRWQEGCSEALSTFKTAEEMTEDFEGFVFNHNEALLYEWVKDNSPELFKKLQKAVEEGRWSIMGGWYLQPDCNMPSGESIVRNIEKGRRFFGEYFKILPSTAVNFDSFGHSRGLVQILKKAGYDSYIVCRPGKNGFHFIEQDFEWVGLDGSAILVHRSDENYNSVWGEALKELKKFLPDKENEKVTLFLWGVGDHGGGPSRKDLKDLKKFAENSKEYTLIHSTPEAYFKELLAANDKFPRLEEGLNPVAEGCYTSQIRVKQKHRELENELYSAEKMAAAAALECGRKYPEKEIKDAMESLIFSEFHDALPGSGSPLVEEDTLRLLDYGLELTSRVKHFAALALARGEKKVKDGSSVIFFYNPHPYDITGVFCCETGLPTQNWTTNFMYPKVMFQGKQIPTQAEKESSNFNLDWRKKVVVQATLKAGSMNRMDVYFEPRPNRPVFPEIVSKPEYIFDNGVMRIVIDTATGLLKEYSINGVPYLDKESLQLVCYDDTHNPWGFGKKDSFSKKNFQLLTPHETAEYCGLSEKVIPAVRIIEDGEVRTTVEAAFGLHNSKAYIRYQMPKEGSSFDIEIGVHFMEKENYLKVILKTPESFEAFYGQIMFGREMLKKGKETVSQKWIMVKDNVSNKALAVINNGTYGASYTERELGITLLRSAGYTSADFIMGKALQEEQWAPRMEQGERFYRFRICGGPVSEIDNTIDREAVAFNEEPYGFSYCPLEEGNRSGQFITIDNPRVIVSAVKKAENFEGYILRLYESTGKRAEANIRILDGEIEEKVLLNGFEVKTYKIDMDGKCLIETGLIEDF